MFEGFLDVKAALFFCSLQNQLPHLLKNIVYTHFEDELNHEEVTLKEIVPTYTSMKSYRDRVELYIKKNKVDPLKNIQD